MNRKRIPLDPVVQRKKQLANRIIAGFVIFMLVSISVDIVTKGRRNSIPLPEISHAEKIEPRIAKAEEQESIPSPAAETPITPIVPAAEIEEPPTSSPPVWVSETRSGDLNVMIEERRIRALVPFSKTFYFLDGPRQRGLTFEQLTLFERFINARLKLKNPQIQVVIIPTPRDRLLPDLVAGRGDIAAGNLTITDKRLENVDFADPHYTGVDEIIVTGIEEPPLTNLFSLAGREIFVRKSSSYFESISKLNNTLRALGKEPVQLTLSSEYLEDEDLLEMVNAGLIPMIVIDSHKGYFWEKIFKGIRLHPDIKLRRDGEIAWAIRKQSPELMALINDFTAKNSKGSLNGNMLFNRYLVNTSFAEKALAAKEREKFNQVVEVFKKYGKQYNFEWLMLIALAYQESGLDNSKKSQAGAVGIMQVRPSTAADPNVGITDIDSLENNVHAGVKYLRFLADRYFDDGDIDALNKQLFVFAAYNAGPAKLSRLRAEAAAKGLQPNIWFNNVEIIAASRIGRETVLYVSNIYKYYIAYKQIRKKKRKKNMGKEALKESQAGLE